MSKYHDDTTQATDAVGISLSQEKLRQFHPELIGWQAWIRFVQVAGRMAPAKMAAGMLAEHVQYGDSRAAVVIHTRPLLVAAYTDEQDAVVILRFANELAEPYRLSRGTKLLTINTYERGKRLAADLVEGPRTTGRYCNIYPVIAEFVSDDMAVIAGRKAAIAAAEWQRTVALAQACLARPNFKPRDGRPLCSITPVVGEA